MHGVGSAPDGDGWKVAAALTAKNIGGGLNYVAVANTLGVSPGAFAAGITADNFFALAYFPIVSWLGGAPLPGGKAGAVVEDVGGGAADWISTDDDDDDAGGWREETAEETETGTSARALGVDVRFVVAVFVDFETAFVFRAGGSSGRGRRPDVRGSDARDRDRRAV